MLQSKDSGYLKKGIILNNIIGKASMSAIILAFLRFCPVDHYPWNFTANNSKELRIITFRDKTTGDH